MAQSRRKRAGALFLTDLKARKATPGIHADGRGLYLLVKPSGARSWFLRYQMDGRRREMGLGPYPAVTLERAREKVQAARALMAEHRDPLAHRGDRSPRKFRTAAEELIKARRPTWQNAKHAAQWEATLETYAFPVLGDLAVSHIGTDEVLRVLNPIWTEKPETATRVRQRIEAVLDYAGARGWREGDNPARWRGHLDKLLAKRTEVAAVEHHAALPWQEMAAFMTTLRQEQGTAARALEFTILTACRTGEVLGARWPEVDLEARLWTVPAERMKGRKTQRRPHRVPLSEPALTLLRSLPRIEGEEHVFPGGKQGKPLSTMAMLAVLRRMGRADLTTHGFRSTFRDWAAESTHFPRELAEGALAHVLKNKAEAAYQRGDLVERRRELMDAWAGWCGGPNAMPDVSHPSPEAQAADAKLHP